MRAVALLILLGSVSRSFAEPIAGGLQAISDKLSATPMAGKAIAFVDVVLLDDGDPGLIVGIAFAESSLGRCITCAPHNPWNYFFRGSCVAEVSGSGCSGSAGCCSKRTTLRNLCCPLVAGCTHGDKSACACSDPY